MFLCKSSDYLFYLVLRNKTYILLLDFSSNILQLLTQKLSKFLSYIVSKIPLNMNTEKIKAAEKRIEELNLLI